MTKKTRKRYYGGSGCQFTTFVIQVGCLRVKALFESGSVKSFIRYDHFKEILQRDPGLSCRPNKGICISASRHPLRIVGETKLHVKIQGFSWNFVFLVVRNLACDLILGSDFMTKTGLVLNLQKGGFYFQFDPKSVFRMARPQRTNFRLQVLIQEPKEKQQGIVLDHLTTK